jgi:hypothetical protein
MKKLLILLVLIALTISSGNAYHQPFYGSVSNGNSFDNYHGPDQPGYNTVDVGGVKANFQLNCDTYVSSLFQTSAKAYVGVQSQYKYLAAQTISTSTGTTHDYKLWPSSNEPVWSIYWGAAIYSRTGTNAWYDLQVDW